MVFFSDRCTNSLDPPLWAEPNAFFIFLASSLVHLYGGGSGGDLSLWSLNQCCTMCADVLRLFFRVFSHVNWGEVCRVFPQSNICFTMRFFCLQHWPSRVSQTHRRSFLFSFKSGYTHQKSTAKTIDFPPTRRYDKQHASIFVNIGWGFQGEISLTIVHFFCCKRCRAFVNIAFFLLSYLLFIFAWQTKQRKIHVWNFVRCAQKTPTSSSDKKNLLTESQ